MTLHSNDREFLVRHKIEKARSLLSEAEHHIKYGFYETAVNRMYYSLYHLASALALKHGFSTSKHGQLIGWFNREFIHTGLAEKKYGKIFSEAFDRRMDSDYEDFIIYEKEEMDVYLNEARQFIEYITMLI